MRWALGVMHAGPAQHRLLQGVMQEGGYTACMPTQVPICLWHSQQQLIALLVKPVDPLLCTSLLLLPLCLLCRRSVWLCTKCCQGRRRPCQHMHLLMRPASTTQLVIPDDVISSSMVRWVAGRQATHKTSCR